MKNHGDFHHVWFIQSKDAKPDKPAAVVSEAMNNQNSSNDTTQPRPKSLKTKPSLPTFYETANVHDLTGANIRLQINNENLIEEARQGEPQGDTIAISVYGGEELVQDFLDMFTLLSATSIERSQYKSTILVSAARIAAINAYDYRGLYSYCIEKLEELSLSSMERIHVARALGLESWEESTYKELSQRKEMITQEEAQTLGMNAYWRVATAREEQKGAIAERIFQLIQSLSWAYSAAKQ